VTAPAAAPLPTPRLRGEGPPPPLAGEGRGGRDRAPGRPLRLGLAVAALLLAADQASKWWILEVAALPVVRHIPLLAAGPFGLDLTMVWNRGVTFGLFAGDGPLNPLILALLASLVAALLLRWMARAETRWVAIALGLVVGGAIGNVIDRLRFGAVVDFVDAHAWGWHWYVFNLADAAIVCGVGVLLADALFRRQATPARDAGG
jgi:lipoprotein signal peptidase